MGDRRILELFFRRDQAALKEVRDRYGSKLHRVAKNIVGSACDAEECVNDALLAAWNAIPPAKPDPLLPWLYATVRHIAVDRFRYNRAGRRGGGETALVLEELEDVISSADSTAEAADRRALAEALKRFLARQSPRDRELLMGRYFAGFSCREMAERLGMTEVNCKVRLSRLRQKLRQYLIKEGVLEP